MRRAVRDLDHFATRVIVGEVGASHLNVRAC